MISLSEPENFRKKFDVVSVFIDHGEETLLLHRQDHKPQGNTWAMVAGKADEGESLEKALAREVEEEIGLKIDPKEFTYFEGYYVRYPEYDFVYHIYALSLEHKPKLTVNTAEHKAHVWIRPTAALQLDLIPHEDFCIKRFYSL